MPGPLDPHEDVTPLRVMIPDHEDRFPCERCGHMQRCPPVARPVRPDLKALKPIDGRGDAPELNPPAGATTRVETRRPNTG